MEWTLSPDAVYVDGDPPDKADIRQSMRDLSRRFSGTGVVSIGEFGAIGDGSAGNAAINLTAINAAIAAALTHGVNRIGIPPGVFYTNAILPAVAGADSLLADGLGFVGAGGQGGLINGDLSRLMYAGTARMFDFRQTDGHAVTGGWSFENLNLTCTNVAGSIAAFNWWDVDNVDYTPTDDGTTPGFMSQIDFNRCTLNGAAGGGAGVDGVLLKKVSLCRFDENTVISGFRRGVTAITENGEFNFYGTSNGRHLQLEAITTFGNNNKVDMRFMGSTIAAGETQYCIYDSSKGMTLLSGLFEPTDVIGACIYLNGTGGRLIAPYFGPTAATPLFEMGATCGDCVMYDPSCPPGVGIAPVIAEAQSYENGNANANRWTLRIVGGNHIFSGKVGRHPRIVWGGDPDRSGRLNNIPHPQRPRIDSTGGRATTIEVIDPLHFPCYWTGMDVSDGVSSRQTDAAAPTGHVFRLLDTGSPGWVRDLTVGRDIRNNDWIRRVDLAKMESAGGAGTWRWQWYKNGAAIGGANGALTDSATFAQTVSTFQVTGCVDGDVISLGIYRAGTDKWLDWAMTTWAIVEVANPDTSGATLANLEIEVNQIKATMRNWNEIAG